MYEEGIINGGDMREVIVIRRWKAGVYKEPIPTHTDGLYFDEKLDCTR